MRVLVVDDMREMRERLVELIVPISGVESVAQAADGDDALALIAVAAPDVIVLDIRMPRMSGFEVLDALSAGPSFIVVIVLTNHVEYRRYALQKGAAFFFDKATQLDGLIATLTDLAAGTLPLAP